MKRTSSIWLFFAAVFLLPVTIYAMVAWYQQNKMTLPIYKDNAEQPLTVASFRFVNQENKTVTEAGWKNNIIVANFFFTHCPVVCPRMTGNLLSVQKAFAADNQVKMVSFSVDPESDSSGRLKLFADRFRINSFKWDLLTGPKQEIYRLARKSFQVVATDGDGGTQDFIHSDKVVLIDKHLHIRGYYSGTDPKDIQQLINDIKRLKDEN